MKNVPQTQRKKISPIFILLGVLFLLPTILIHPAVGLVLTVASIAVFRVVSNRKTDEPPPALPRPALPRPPSPPPPSPPPLVSSPSNTHIIQEWVDFIDSLGRENDAILKQRCQQILQTTTNPRILLFGAAILEDLPALHSFASAPSPLSGVASILLSLLQHHAKTPLHPDQYYEWAARLVDATTPLQLMQRLTQLTWLLDASLVAPFITDALASGQPELIKAAQHTASQYEGTRLFKLASSGDLSAIQQLLDSPKRFTEFSERAVLLRALFTNPSALALPDDERASWIQQIANTTTPQEYHALITQLQWLLTPTLIEYFSDKILSPSPSSKPPITIFTLITVAKSNDLYIQSIMQKAVASNKEKALADIILEMGRQDIQSAASQWPPLVNRFGKDVNLAITQALGLLSCKGFETTLRALLSHMDIQVATAAAHSLGKKGSIADLPALRAFADTTLPNTSHRNAATAAIAHIIERGDSGQVGDLTLLPSSPQHESPPAKPQNVQTQFVKPIAEQLLWDCIARHLNLSANTDADNRLCLEGTYAGLTLRIQMPKADGDAVILQFGQEAMDEAVWTAHIQRGGRVATSWQTAITPLNVQGLSAAVGLDRMRNAAILSPAAREHLAKLKVNTLLRWDGTGLEMSVPQFLEPQARLDIRRRAGHHTGEGLDAWLDATMTPLVQEITSHLNWMTAWLKIGPWPSSPLESFIARLWDETSETLRWSALQLMIEHADKAPEDLILACCREGIRRGNPKERLLCAPPILQDNDTIQSLQKDPTTAPLVPLLIAWSHQIIWHTLKPFEKFKSVERALSTTEPTARAKMLDQLTKQLDQSYTAPLIQQALQSEQPVLVSTAILAAGHYDMQREARDWVRFLYRFGTTVDEAIAQAFGLLSCGGYEHRLHELLNHPTLEVKIAAAESLGKKGSLADVPALRALIPSTSDGEPLHVALHAAINLILERAGGLGQHGDLALIDSNPKDAGALSFPKSQPEQEGALSFSEDKTKPHTISNKP